MYKVQGYLGTRRVIDHRMAHLPRVGDIVRLFSGMFARVNEVVWCMDEEEFTGENQRVNLAMEVVEQRLPAPNLCGCCGAYTPSGHKVDEIGATHWGHTLCDSCYVASDSGRACVSTPWRGSE